MAQNYVIADDNVMLIRHQGTLMEVTYDRQLMEVKFDMVERHTLTLDTPAQLLALIGLLQTALADMQGE